MPLPNTYLWTILKIQIAAMQMSAQMQTLVLFHNGGLHNLSKTTVADLQNVLMELIC